MYQLFYDGEELTKQPNLSKRKSADDVIWTSKSKDARLLTILRRLFSRMEAGDLEMAPFMAEKMARWRSA